MLADKMLGAFELGAIVAWGLDLSRLFADKRLHGRSLWAVVFWNCYGLVQIWFTASLRQPYAMAAFIACEVASMIYLAMALVYRNREAALSAAAE